MILQKQSFPTYKRIQHFHSIDSTFSLDFIQFYGVLMTKDLVHSWWSGGRKQDKGQFPNLELTLEREGEKEGGGAYPKDVEKGRDVERKTKVKGVSEKCE